MISELCHSGASPAPASAGAGPHHARRMRRARNRHGPTRRPHLAPSRTPATGPVRAGIPGTSLTCQDSGQAEDRDPDCLQASKRLDSGFQDRSLLLLESLQSPYPLQRRQPKDVLDCPRQWITNSEVGRHSRCNPGPAELLLNVMKRLAPPAAPGRHRLSIIASDLRSARRPLTDRLPAMQEVACRSKERRAPPVTCYICTSAQPYGRPHIRAKQESRLSAAVRIYTSELGVELRGFEPRTSCMPCKRSTN